MTQLPEGFEKVEKNPQTEPPTSFKELPEGFEKVGKITELPEDFVKEDDLSIDEIKKMQSEGVKLSDKLQRKLFDADDERSFLDKASGAIGAALPAAADIIGSAASGVVQLTNKAVVQPAALALTGGYGDLNSERAKKVFKERDEALRSGAIGLARDAEETANAAVRFAMFGSATTDKLLGKSKEERFRAWQDRQVMKELEAQSAEENPDRANYLLSQNPLIQAYVGYEAEKLGLSPEEVEKAKQDYIQSMLDSGLTKEQINEDIASAAEIFSPISIPGAGIAGKFASKVAGKALSKVSAPIANKIGNLPARAIGAVAGGTEFAANKVLQGTEFTQTVAKNIGQYAINDPDTWIKGTVNTAILPVVAVAKPTASVARVVKDIARQVDVGGTAGRRGILERTGDDALSGKLAKGLFGPESKGGVARAKIGDWMIRQSNALIQPSVNAAALNVVMGLPDIETAEDLGYVAGTGLGIGAIGGSRAMDRVGGLIDPRTTMAEKITNLVTPDPAAYRRDEDADIKRFMAQASPEIQQNISDLSNIESRKAAIETSIANLEKKRDAQINPDDAAFDQTQIDGFLKQKEALSKATPETQAEATRQTALAFIDAYDLAQSTGGVAGLRGVNIAVLDPANADQFFRDLYGDSLKQAETTINLLTGIPSLTETDSQKLTEARQLLQKFQNDVEGAKSARGFALQEDNTDPNSEGFVPPHLRRINQQGATAVINADLIKHMTSQGLNLRHTLQHEVQHAVQQFAEVNKMLAPIRGQLFDQKIKNDDGSVEVYQQGYYSDEDLDRYATQYAKMMSPSDNGASFYAQFGGEVEKMRAYIKDEILAETAAATGEYAGGTRASLDDVGRNVMDWFEVKTKSGRLKQLKETLRKGGIIFDNAGGYSSVLGAKMSPETLAMMRQYQRGLKDFDGTMTVQQSRESDEPDIPLTKVLGSVALQNKYRHADFFEKEQIIKATAPDGSVTEIVVPAGAKIDPFIDVYRTQNGQLVDANGNVVTLGPEITFGSMPDGTTFETDTRIARKSNGSPIILTNREMKARARERTKIIQTAIDSAKNDGSGVRLADTGNGNYRGVMSPAQIEAFMALPNEVVSPNLKRMTKFFNELMAKNDGTRVVMEYQAALLNGKYKALSPKIRDEVPIGFQITQDGNFALTTISVSRLYDKMQAWADKKPENLQPWNGDTGAFWDSLIKLLDNHSRGEKGETGLHPDAYIAGKMKNKINDLFNAYNAETKESNPDRSTLPRARGKDNLDIVIRSRRLDRINNFSESPSQKLPINYGYLTTNYMPAVNPMAAPMTAEEVQNRFDGSVTATRVRKAMATGEIDALESELRQMDDLLPTESLQLVQGQDQMPRIQIVSMFDPENIASLEPEEIVSDIDAETEAELAILDAQDGTVPPQDIAKVLSAKLDQLYADGGRSPIIPALETELEKIYQELESQAQEQAAATEEIVEAPETTEVDMMNSPQDLILAAVDNYNSGKADNATQTLPEYIRSVVNEAGALQISPDITDEQIVAAANDVMQYRQSLKDRIQSGTRFENAVVAPAGLQYLPAFHASRADFDKFNLDFINSGNKEQVYGWGLYFAENRKEIDKFVPLQYQYKVDIDIDENNLLDWGASLDPRLNDAAEKLKNEIELDTLSGVRIYTNQDYYEALSEYLGDPKNASMQLKAMGFDGIKYTDRITQSKQKQIGLTAEQIASIPTTFNYVIFDNSKIKILDKGDKSLGPITQFMPAVAEAPSGERGFQSKLQMEIQRNFKGAKATPDQLKAVITNPQNVKQEEVKWSGVLDAIDRLAGENNGKVPVVELMNYLRNEGQVKFEEVTLGKDRSVEDIADTYRIKIEDQYGEAAFYDEFDDPLEFDELPFALQNAINNASKLPAPKYAKYQLPGGENYREVVMAMPPVKTNYDTGNSRVMRPDETQGMDNARFWFIKTPDQTFQILKKDHATAQSAFDYVLREKQPELSTATNYTSSHFPNIPNYVAHMRLNERTDAEGNDGLFIEELQSDRHQAGREKGYKSDSTEFYLKSKNGGQNAGPFATRESADFANDGTFTLETREPMAGVPDAPFRKDWSLQLFKRALRDAVESGKQWIGWTAGETQAERYDLSKQIDRIEYNEDKQGGRLTGEKGTEMPIIQTGITPDKLADYIGKETAQKLLAQEKDKNGWRVLENADLKVGGEGMKGFYDQILPKEIGKYVGKMGGKVEKSEIAKSTQENIEKKAEELARENGILPDEESLEWLTGRDRNRFIEEAEQELNLKPTPIWRVNITPEMANIVSAGQLQFMPAVQTIPERFTGTGEKGEERRGRYVAPPEFWTRFDIGEFEQGGKFFDIETGEDITNKTYGTGTIDVTGKRPSLVSDSIIDEMPDEKGRTWKTNLFRKSAGWEWISENPPEVATIGSKQKPNPVLISVENNPDHFYSLKVDFPNGVKLARYPKSGEPRLRPTKKGEIQFGNEVGRIRTSKGKEHPVYDTITIGQPQFMPAGEGLPLSDATAPERQQQVEKPLGMVALPKKPTPVERTMQADAGDFSVVIGGKPGKYGFGYTTVADLAPKVELSEQRKKDLIKALSPRNDELNKKRDALLEVGNLYWESIDIEAKDKKSDDDIQRSEEIADLLNEFRENPDRDFTMADAIQVAEVDRLTRSINLMNRGMVPAPFKFPVDNREVPVPVEKPADIPQDASKEDKVKYAKELAAYEAFVALKKKQEQDVSVGLKSLQGAVATLFKTKKFKEFIAEAAGLTGIQFDNILGTWKFEPEPSFVFSAQGMTWEQAQSVTKWLSVLMTQDAGIAWKPSIGLAEGAQSIYLVHDKKLTDEQILNAFKKAKEVGIDGLSVTVDGRGIKAANFDNIDKFDDKLVEIQKTAKIKNIHNTLVDSFYYDTTSDFTADDGSLKVPDWIKGESINEENTQDQQGGTLQEGRATGNNATTRGFPILLRRGIDSVLIPYAKSLAGEGFTFDPDRFAERYGLGQEVADYIREQLYPTTGLSRSVTPILDGTEKFTVPESYYTKGGRLKTSVNDLMYALQKRSADDGFIQPGDYSTRAGQIVAETIVDEIQGHIERASKNPEAPNAIGWYDTALKKMKQKYSQFFPFLNRGTPTYDADKEFIFDSVLGIASQGNNVFENGKMAARVQFLLESGKTLPEIKDELYGTFGGETRAIENNLLKLDELIKNNGIQALDKLFRKKMTVSEWNGYFKKNKNLWFKGKPLTVDGQADQMVTGFSVFGPKIGSFINNLHGDYTTLTADLWYTRTWNRILGNVFQHAPLKEANQFNSFRKTILEQYRSDSAQSAGEKFEPLLKRVNKDGEKEFFDYMQEPELDGISRDNLDKLLADQQKMLEFATALEDRYRKGQYKAKSDLRRAAKNWVENRTDPVAAPRTDLERDFQQDVMEIAQKKLRRKGIDITIADMQAALWYNEKELFGLYGAQVSGSEPADYADAADNVDEIMAYASLFKVNRLVEVDGKKRTEIVRLLTPEEEVALTGVQNAKTPEEYVALLAARKKAEDDENAAEKKLEEAELKVAKFERELATATDEKSKQKLQASLEKAKMTLSNLTGGTKETSPDLTGKNQE